MEVDSSATEEPDSRQQVPSDDYQARLLSRVAGNQALKTCRISCSLFSDEDARMLATLLPQTPSLRKLDIVKCPRLTASGVSALCRGLARSHITHLSLEYVAIGNEGLVAIADMLESTENDDEEGCRLKSLGLEDNGAIDPRSWRHFFSVAVGRLRSLDVGRNGLTKERLTELITDLSSPSSTLEALILSENPIGDETMEALCEAVEENATLRLLAVGDCKLTDQSLLALRRTLRQNTVLERVYQYGNAFSSKSDKAREELKYLLDLNVHGCRALIRKPAPTLPGVLPWVLSTVNDRPALLYGLLQELPHTWAIVG